MSGKQSNKPSSIAEEVSQLTPKNTLEQFIIQIQGNFNFAATHYSVYPNIHTGHTAKGKIITFLDLNYHLYLFNLIIISLVSNFEAFIEEICRKSLLKRRNLFGQFDPSISWKEIPQTGNVDVLWEKLAEQVLDGLESGRLNTFIRVLKKLGVTVPNQRSKIGRALAELVLRRNLIVHNRNKPDKNYLKVIPSPKTFPSGALVIDIGYVEEACNLLVDTARDIIRQLVKNGTLDSSEL